MPESETKTYGVSDATLTHYRFDLIECEFTTIQYLIHPLDRNAYSYARHGAHAL